MSSEPQNTPLVILGFDAADPRLLRRWAQEGHLPTLASIMQRGCWAQTGGPELALEHGVWHSLFSGISRGRHGYHYFRQLKPRSYDLQSVHGSETDAPPFWASLRDRGKRVVVMDAPDVALVPGLAGAQFVNWAIHRGWVPYHAAEMPASEPADLLHEANRVAGPPLQIIEVPNADPPQNHRIRRDLLRRVETKGAVARWLVERERPDLVVICLCESHTAGHQFWRYCAEVSAHRPAGEHGFANAIREVYQAIDRQMGLLLAQIPPTANVVVISSLGLADHYPTGGLLEAFCRRLGYQAPAERGPVSFRPMALARRVVPEAWRIALSRHLSRERRERLLAQQFRSATNWRKTTAFVVPSFYTGFLRVNLRGREPEGIVEPGAQYEAVLQRLEADLRQLMDPQTGQPAIEKVMRMGEVFGCTPPEVLPDLVVHWKSCAHFVDRVVHPQAELVQARPEFCRDSDHSDHGFLAAAGPAIRQRGQIEEVAALDLAPTFLALLNEPKPTHMTGAVLSALLQ